MHLRSATFCLCLVLTMAAPAHAQFTGPSVQGQGATAAAVQDKRIGNYVTLTGRITAHLREDYYRFADDSGEVRVEIPRRPWRGREIGPETTVRPLGEVDRNRSGTRYVWVKSLDPLK